MIAAAITLYDLVSTGNVVDGHGGYGDPVFPSFGTNADFAPTTDPVQPDLGLAGVIGWTQPANAAVDPAVVVPGYGLGTAQLAAIPPTTEIPCDLEPKTLYTFCGQTKTHRIVPADEDGAAIDTQGAALTFVIEDQEGYDLETGTATQNPPVGDPLLGADDVGSEIMFTSQAANDNPGEYRFAVRVTATNSPICFGTLIVRNVAKIGDPTPVAGTQSSDLQNICESIRAIEELLDSGATSVTQDGQTVVFDRKDARKRLRQLQQRKLDLEAVANGTGRRAKRRRPLLNRIDLRGY